MAKKIGLDTKKAKEFLMQKGERVGLVGAAILTLLVLVLGFLGISTSPPAKAGARTWGGAIDNAAQKLDQAIRDSRPPADDGKGDPKFVFEDDIMVLAKFWGPLFEESIGTDTKRRNPYGVVCPSGPENIQMSYLRAPALRYQPDARGRQYTVIDVGDQPASYALDGRRMVVVTAGFPVNDQLDIFVQSLQAGDREKLLAGPDVPRIIGLEVYRQDFLKEGKPAPADLADENNWSKGDALYVWDSKTEKFVVAKHLDEFFRQMVIDDSNPKHLADVLGPNMVTPLPLLATIAGTPGRYPKTDIKDVEVADQPAETKPKKGLDKDKGGFKFPGDKKQPVGKQPELPEGKTTLAEAPKELQERFLGNYNVFDPFGGFLNAPAMEKEKGKKEKFKGKLKQKPPPMNEKPGKETEKKPLGQPITQEAARLLLRFIDVDVEPGKTYRYHFRVRLANPNYGKSTEVAALDLSKNKELEGGKFTTTESITIPQESFYYAVDQIEINKAIKMPLHSFGNDTFPGSAEMTPVQIHRWINRFQAEDGTERRIGDWVIAERLLIKRGELIGRKKVIVEIPEWYDNNNRFDLGKLAIGKGLKPARVTPVDFLIDETKVPVLVDFHAAKKSDEGATELLVLGPDGKLSVRNSREDSDLRSNIGKERQRHYERWAERLNDLRSGNRGSVGGGGGSPIFPGGKKGA